MQRMLEAQAATAAARAAAQAAAAKQEQMMKQMMERMVAQQREQLEQQSKASAQQDREMALLAQEFKALGSKADSEADAPADKKSSACVVQ